ncbi:MAG TPA: sugar transferase [Chloroflexota bacterium]|nr:sugar transferase [Chloroflexota bacterium]
MTIAHQSSAESRAQSVARARQWGGLSTQRRLQLASLVILDIASGAAAFSLAYWLRYVNEIGGDVPGESDAPYSAYAPVLVLFVLACVVGNQLRGAYALPRGTSMSSEATSFIGTAAAATMLVFAAVSMARYPASSRLMFIYAWMLACVLGIGGRILLRALLARLYRAGYGTERVIVVGNHRLARMVMQLLAQQRHLGYQVLGFVDRGVNGNFGRFSVLGAVEDLPTLIGQLEINRVIVALPADRHTEALWVLEHCRRDGVAFSLVPDLFDLRLSHLNLETVGGIPVFRVGESPLEGWNQVVKRLIDVVASALLLVALAPLCILIAVAIKLDSPGGIFFRQIRLGKGGAPFIVYKYRSMRDRAEDEVDALIDRNEADGPIFKIRDDPRLTRVGRVLRRTSLDELPQLWNVLRGEMSLVGPRPPIPAEVERYEDWHRRRLEVVPGLTGLWQVSGRSELSFDEMVMLDIYYIENWSLSLDIQILARTIPAVLAAAGAF